MSENTKPMRCENYKSSFDLQTLRAVNVRCDSSATTEISINPPREGNDGKIRVCDHCARLDFDLFKTRTELPAHPDTLTDEAKLRRSQALDELGALDGELLP